MRRSQSAGQISRLPSFTSISTVSNRSTTRWAFRLSDKILQQVAERIRASAGSENTLARLGSDEFAILQTGKQQPRNVTALAEQIRRELSAPFLHGEKQLELSVSMGIAIAPGDGEETDILLKNA